MCIRDSITAGAPNYVGLRMYQTDGSFVGYFYGDSGSGTTPNIGILDSDGNWAVRVIRDTYTELRVNNSVKFQSTTNRNYNLQSTWIEGGSADWNETTPGTSTGSLHLDPGSGTDNFGSAITFGASDASSGTNAQAGIYTRSDGSYGTKMYFATTDSYASGSKTRMFIDHSGDLYVGGSTDYAGKINIEQGGSPNGIVLNNTDTTPPRLYLRDAGGAGYSEISANNDLYLNASAVGIGLSDPTRQLHLKRTSGDVRGIMVETTVATSYAEVQVKAASEFRIGTGGSSTTPNGQFYIYDATSGAHRFDIDASGHVGIGTVSPYDSAWGSNSKQLTISGTDYGVLNLIDTGGPTRFGIGAGDGKLYLAYDDVAGAHRIVVDSSGNVGIGTTNPKEKLHIQSGNIGLTTGMKIGWLYNPTAVPADDNMYNYIKTANVGGVPASHIEISGSRWTAGNTPSVKFTHQTGGDIMTLMTGGNVGIGTDPSQKLHIHNSATLTATYQKFTNGTATTGTTLGIDADGDFLINNGEAKEIKLYTNDTQRLTINSAGLVAINTTPQFGRELLVKGEISAFAQDSGDNQLLLAASSTQTNISATYGSAGSYVPMQFETGGAIRMTIGASGNVGIGGSPSSAAGVANFLSVRGSSHAGIVLQDTDGGAIHEMWNDGGTLNMWDNSVGYRIRFYTSGDAQAYNGWGAASLGITGSNGTDGKGLSLYGGSSGGEPTYGMMFMQTATFGTYGSVSGDYATYFTMNNNASRGWIFRRVGNANYASISAGGDLSLSGQVYFPTTAQRIAGLNATYLQIKSGSASDGGINFVNTSATNLGYIYASGSDYGMLNAGGYWIFKHAQGGNIDLYAGNQSVNWSFRTNGYAYFPSWINLAGGTGLFTSTNSAHFYGNTGGTYGAWRTSGSRNGYSGTYDNHSTNTANMFDSSGNGGNFNSTTGWHFYYNRSNTCLGVGNSTTASSYSLYVTGKIYSTDDIIAYSDKRVKENIVTVDSAIEKAVSYTHLTLPTILLV
mgnify:CR=1 FL=1